jgi:hypothetical protein
VHGRPRAWTFQEGQLSQRKIQFGYSRIYICGAKKNLMEQGDTMECNDFKSLPSAVQQYQRDGDLPALHRVWEALVESYTGRRSTNERDRFPALSRLAKLMAEATGDTYLAGL